jgi:septum formation protein
MILGKPVDESHARDMLERLSSRRHRVYTGISLRLLHRGRLLQEFNEFVVTTLQMDSLSGDMLEQYLESGQWEGKAGAFGYQDGLDWVRVVAGSESNVVGLPMERVCELLADLGVGRGD